MEKTLISLRIEKEMWKEFKKYCIDIDDKPSRKLRELIKKELKFGHLKLQNGGDKK